MVCNVDSIACYVCEVWGFHFAPKYRTKTIIYCKNLLHVKRYTDIATIKCEFGRIPLQRKLRK